MPLVQIMKKALNNENFKSIVNKCLERYQQKQTLTLLSPAELTNNE